MASPGLGRRKVLATVVHLLETTMIRVGNLSYAKENKSYGLTTLRDRHVEIDGPRIHLSFRGKHGIRNETDISDRRLARIIKDCQDLPGYELFQYVDDEGNRHIVDSGDVNAAAYLDKLNLELLTRLQASGEAYLSNAVVHGKFALRACIVNFRTSRTDVEALLPIVVRMGGDVDLALRPGTL